MFPMLFSPGYNKRQIGISQFACKLSLTLRRNLMPVNLECQK